MAYFQASVLVEHIVDEYGESTIHQLLRAYGDGLDTEEALARVNLDFDTLQASFDVAVEARVGDLRRALEGPDEPMPQEGDALGRLRELVTEYPDSFPVQMALGRALRQAGETDEARLAYERAAELAPMATGASSAHLPLANIALEQEDPDRAMRHLESHLDHDHRDIEAVRRLAALAEDAGDEARMRRAYELAIEIDPFDSIPHEALGRLAVEREDHAVAALEFEVALALGPIDRVAAHVQLAEVYLAAGRGEDAKREVMAAREIAPTYERAQDLLLDIVGAGL